MSITQWSEKIKPFWRLIFIILLAFSILGFLELSSENKQKTPIKILNLADVSQTMNTSLSSNNSTTVIASKSGKKYYYPSCAGVKRIKPENQVQFATPALAEAAGYTLAVNCKAIQ